MRDSAASFSAPADHATHKGPVLATLRFPDNSFVTDVSRMRDSATPVGDRVDHPTCGTLYSQKYSAIEQYDHELLLVAV